MTDEENALKAQNGDKTAEEILLNKYFPLVKAVAARFFLCGGESEDYRYTGGVIDLRDCLNDAVMLSLPARLVCGKNCIPLEWKEQ